MGCLGRLGRSIRAHARANDLLLLTLYVLPAAALLTNFDFNPFAAEQYGLVFNDMALRLTHWDFSSDPRLIRGEGFGIDGKVYAYFGIFPALLRLPLVLLGGGGLQVARISCLLALGIFVWANIRIAGLVIETAEKSRLSTIWIVSLLYSGPQIYLLSSAWIFHEPEFWGAALAALFNLFALKAGAAGHWPQDRNLAVLALLAGLTLLTRAPAGMGLYAALSIFILMALGNVTAWRHCIPAIALAIAGLAAAATVNQARWGDPLVFARMDKQIIAASSHQIEVMRERGVLSPSRIPFSSFYYLSGLPMKEQFAAYIDRNYGIVEGPRIPILLASPHAFLLAGYGCIALIRSRRLASVPVILLMGQTLGALLVLSFSSLTLRYTIDLWGALGVAALVGLKSLTESPPRRSKTMLMASLAALGIAVSLLTLVRYKITANGVPNQVRFELSRQIRPLICPTKLPTGTLRTWPPLITPSCPPFW